MYRNKELYDERNELKQNIHFQQDNQNQRSDTIFINEREIRYVSLWLNIWFEENGKLRFRRPVLVIRKVGNLFFVVALTSKWKEKNRFYHRLCNAVFNERNLKYTTTSYCVLSQVRVIDKKRFTEIVWSVWSEEFSLIKQKLRELLL